MATIEHSATLPATPQQVFVLLERVEDFADYSDLIERIEPLGGRRYRWHIKAVGMDWTFDVEITECVAPERLAWESLDGVHNQGCYRLREVANGTEVSLTIEYRINNRLLERVVNRAAKPLVSKVSRQILERVEARL